MSMSDYDCKLVAEKLRYDKLIRKLRKRLRQIEHLELLERQLNDEEAVKVRRKAVTRNELARVLKLQNADCHHVQSNQVTHQHTAGNLNKPHPVAVKPEPKLETETIPKVTDAASSNVQQPVQKLEPKAKTEPATQVPKTAPPKPAVTVDKASTKAAFVDDKASTKATVTADKASTRTAQATSTKASTKAMGNFSSTEPERPSQKKSAPSPVKPSASLSSAAPERLTLETFPLEAHCDIVTCVDVSDRFIISGSRDTTVQLWDCRSGSHIKDLRGHSNSITCVRLLPSGAARKLGYDLPGHSADDDLALTCSLDCYVKLWHLASSTVLRQIYTFSGVTSVCYTEKDGGWCIVGSEAGKLSVYNLAAENVEQPLCCSVNAFQQAVTGICVAPSGWIVCGSLDGYLGAWVLLKGGNSLEWCCWSWSNESARTDRERPIRSLTLSPCGSVCVYADGTGNLKSVNIASGGMMKIRNAAHPASAGSAVCAADSLLVSASTDLDTGSCTLVVHSLPPDWKGAHPQYLYSVPLEGFGRVTCIALRADAMVVAGCRLLLLRCASAGSSKSDSGLKVSVDPRMSLACDDSPSERDSSCSEITTDDDSSDDEYSDGDSADHAAAKIQEQQTGWSCSIL